MMCRIRIVSKVTVGAAHSVLIKVGCGERMGGGGGGRGGGVAIASNAAAGGEGESDLA